MYPGFYGQSHLFQGQTCKFIFFVIQNYTITFSNNFSLEIYIYQNRFLLLNQSIKEYSYVLI